MVELTQTVSPLVKEAQVLTTLVSDHLFSLRAVVDPTTAATAVEPRPKLADQAGDTAGMEQ